MRSKWLRSTAGHANARSIRCVAAIAALAVLPVGAPVAALHAASGAVDVKDIRVVGTPKLFFERPGTDPGGDIAWVVFQTRPRLRVVRQVVVELRGRRGRSHTARGANCIRSTILQGAVGLKHGARYRVRFYGRPSRFGEADALLATRTLVARGIGSPGKRPAAPNCRS
jgi:hypothetical protein